RIKRYYIAGPQPGESLLGAGRERDRPARERGLLSLALGGGFGRRRTRSRYLDGLGRQLVLEVDRCDLFLAVDDREKIHVSFAADQLVDVSVGVRRQIVGVKPTDIDRVGKRP